MREPISDWNTFLQRVADRLPFDQAERIEILRELAVHLSDSSARLEAEGLTRDAAERAAIERLGPPDVLADALTAARRSPRRLLAAAGAGTYAALGGAVYGYFLGLLAVIAGSIVTVVLAASPLHAFGGSWGGILGTTTITLIAIAVGLYAAGHQLTATAAARSGYRPREVRWLTSVLGGLLVLAYALIGWRGTLDWPNAVVLLSLPLWFVTGAWRASVKPFPSHPWRLGVFVIVLLVIPVALALGMGSAGTTSGGGSFRPAGVERVARSQPESIAAAMAESGGPLGRGLVTMYAVMNDPTVLDGWHDLRVEAWRGIRTDAEFPGDWTLDPSARQWIASGPASVEMEPFGADTRVRLEGSVSIDRYPSVTLAWLAITGVGPDGNRYILHGLSFITTTFNGTGLDWLTAVTTGR
jgi:hypothetical protein